MSKAEETFNDVWEKLKAEDKTGVYERAEVLSFITNEALEYAYNNGYKAGRKDAKRPQNEWISVSERLPDDRSTVLVTAYWHETYQVMQGAYFGEKDGGWWCVPFNNCGEHMRNDLHVIAWQPSPETYKEGGAE